MVTRVNATLAHSRLSRDLLEHQVAARVPARGVSGQAGQHHAGPRLLRHDLRRHGALGARARPGVRAPPRPRRSVGELIADGVEATARVAARQHQPRDRAPVRAAGPRGGRRGEPDETLRAGHRADARPSSTSTTPPPRSRRSPGPTPAAWARRPSTTSGLRRASRCARRWRPPRTATASPRSTRPVTRSCSTPACRCWRTRSRDGAPTLDAIVSLHVGLLASHPDTLIAAQGRRRGGAGGHRGGARGARRDPLARGVRRLAARRRPPAEPRDDRRPGRRRRCWPRC